MLLGLTAALVGIKLAWLTLLGGRVGLSPSSAARFGITLSQGGEFGFVLFGLAAAGVVLPEVYAQRAMVVITLSMVSTPLLLNAYELWRRRAAPAREEAAYELEGYEHNPVIIAGFGRYGQMTGRLLRMLGIPFTALEIDPLHIDFVGKFGNKVFYGDAGRADLLHAAKAEHAQVLVVAVDDVDAAVGIVRLARTTFPHLRILARARNRLHAFALLDAGADDVRRETLASAMETATEALIGLRFDRARAADLASRFRALDEETLAAQAAVWTDEDKVRETAMEAAARLEKLFATDEVA